MKKADVTAGQLSGGQKQRVAIARAIAIICECEYFNDIVTQNECNRIKGSRIYAMIVHPDISYLCKMSSDGVLFLLYETISIAFVGTLIGGAIAFFASFLNSTKLMPTIIAIPVRLLIMAIRTIPVFIYGLMFIRVTGPGSFAGVLTLGICSIGLISKRFTVAIDKMDLSAWNAVGAILSALILLILLIEAISTRIRAQTFK